MFIARAVIVAAFSPPAILPPASAPRIARRSHPQCTGTSTSSDTQTDLDESFSEAWAWLVACGGERGGVAVGETDGLRGVVASTSLPPNNADALRVPVALGLSDSTLEFAETPMGLAVPAPEWLLLPVDARLALRLLYEREQGAASPWSHYIGMLPQHVHVGRHLSEESLAALQSEEVAVQARESAQVTAVMYERVRSLADKYDAPGICPFDEETWGWALDMIHSRSYTIDAGARGLCRFLVPFIDLLNHDPDGCEFVYDEVDEAFTVETSGHPPRQGEPVVITYGERTSEELLLVYGFVPPAPTPFDAHGLRGAYRAVDVVEGDASAGGDGDFADEKRALLSSLRYDAPRCFEVGAARCDPAVVSALRLACLEEAEFRDPDCCGMNWNRPLAHAPVSAANEARVAAALGARLRAHQAEEPTSLEDDLKLRSSLRAGGSAAGGTDEVGMANALQLRINRKAVVASFLDLLDAFEGGNLLDHFDDFMPSIRVL